MIVVINSLGGLVSIQDEDLFQGSTKLNKIDLVAPFADNVVWKANFEMPDGTYEPEDLDGYLFTPSVKIVDNLNVWKLLVTFPITQDYGIVTMQLRGYIGDVIVCTTSIKLPIQKGVPYDSNFEELSDKDQLLQLISDLRALLSGKVNKVNYVYEKLDNVTSENVGVYYVYDYELNDYKTVTLPQDYDENTEYYKVVSIGRITNIDNQLFLEYIDDVTAQGIKLKLEKDKVTINDKQVVVFDDLTARNVTYDNNVSGIDAKDVQDAIDKLRLSVEDANISSVVDLGDFTLSSAGWQLVDNLYEYIFTHEMFTNALIQSIVVTPSVEAIDSLNNADVLVYPEIDIIQAEENVAKAIIRANKQPSFDILANIKLQGHKVNALQNIPANMVSFNSTDKISSDNVQGAIGDVQHNVDTLDSKYETDKVWYVRVDESGKIPVDMLPGYGDAAQVTKNKEDILGIKTGEIQVGTAGLSDDARKVLGVSLRADSTAVFGNYTVPKTRNLWTGEFNSSSSNSIALTTAIQAGDILEFLIQIGNGGYKPMLVRAGNIGNTIKLSDFSVLGGITKLSQIELRINTATQFEFIGGTGVQISTSGVISADSPSCVILKIDKVLQ